MNFNNLKAAVQGTYQKWNKPSVRGYGRTKRRNAGPLTLAQVKAVQKIHDKGMPKKYVDTELAQIDTDSVPVFSKLTMPSQGSTDDDRIGDRIRVSSIQLRLNSYLSSNTSFQRYVLIQWLQDDSLAAPVKADIFEDTTLGSEVALYNVNNSSKFRVIWDHTLNNRTGAATRQFLHKILKPAVKKVRFNEGLTTGYGHFYLISMGNQADATDDFNLYARIRYFDA